MDTYALPVGVSVIGLHHLVDVRGGAFAEAAEVRSIHQNDLLFDNELLARCWYLLGDVRGGAQIGLFRFAAIGGKDANNSVEVVTDKRVKHHDKVAAAKKGQLPISGPGSFDDAVHPSGRQIARGSDKIIYQPAAPCWFTHVQCVDFLTPSFVVETKRLGEIPVMRGRFPRRRKRAPHSDFHFGILLQKRLDIPPDPRIARDEPRVGAGVLLRELGQELCVIDSAVGLVRGAKAGASADSKPGGARAKSVARLAVARSKAKSMANECKTTGAQI